MAIEQLQKQSASTPREVREHRETGLQQTVLAGRESEERVRKERE